MGRNNKKYHKSLHQQAYQKLQSMQSFGQSKHADRAAIRNDYVNNKDTLRISDSDPTKDKIYSYSTYQSYWKHVKYFVKWIGENHPECTTLKAAKAHVNEWLQSRVDQGLSAWTIHLETAALGKLYGIDKDDPNRFVPPTRSRADIMRSRTDAKRDSHFSETNNDLLIKFCKGTGLRRAGLESIRGRDLLTRDQIEAEITRIEAIPIDRRTPEDQSMLNICKDTRLFDFPGQEYFVHTVEKGGKARIAPIIGPNVDKIIEKFKEAEPDSRVWTYCHSGADIHGYRADYARELYRIAERTATDAQKGRLYCCRRDLAGLHLQRHALYVTSKALGHNRMDVAVAYVARGL